MKSKEPAGSRPAGSCVKDWICRIELARGEAARLPSKHLIRLANMRRFDFFSRFAPRDLLPPPSHGVVCGRHIRPFRRQSPFLPASTFWTPDERRGLLWVSFSLGLQEFHIVAFRSAASLHRLSSSCKTCKTALPQSNRRSENWPFPLLHPLFSLVPADHS